MVGFALTGFERPIPDRQSDMIQAYQTQVSRQDIQELHTYPAAAICAKSFSVIQVSQCCFRTLLAVELSTYWPNVHSSTMRSSPVLSKIVGVIHGW